MEDREHNLNVDFRRLDGILKIGDDCRQFLRQYKDVKVERTKEWEEQRKHNPKTVILDGQNEILAGHEKAGVCGRFLIVELVIIFKFFIYFFGSLWHRVKRVGNVKF